MAVEPGNGKERKTSSGTTIGAKVAIGESNPSHFQTTRTERVSRLMPNTERTRDRHALARGEGERSSFKTKKDGEMKTTRGELKRASLDRAQTTSLISNAPCRPRVGEPQYSREKNGGLGWKAY